jgi:hypothetical protein
MFVWIFFLVLVCGTRAQNVRTFQLHLVCKVCVRIYIRNAVDRPHLREPSDGVRVKVKKIRRGHEPCSEGCETLLAV